MSNSFHSPAIALKLSFHLLSWIFFSRIGAL